MNIIQSFWSKPAYHQEQNFKNNRKLGGWLEYKYFLMSNCLSFLTLQREHSKVDLYTDKRGYEIFINQLGLPYEDVSTILDEIDNEDHRLWVLGKLKTIKLQKKPFIHVDNDVFIWKPFPKSNASNFLIAQSKHPVPKVYQDSLFEVNKHFTDIPPQLSKDIKEYKNIVNIGILGGNDIDFFQNYCNVAYQFLESNLNRLEKISVGPFNQILDEFFVSCLLNERNDVYYHVDSSNEKNALDSVLRFHLTPIIDKYIHLVGVAKQNKFACQQLELRLKYEFPEYHKRVLDLLPSTGFEIKNSKTNYDKLKDERVYRAIKKIYTTDLESIKNTKIQLCNNFKFFEQVDESKGTKYTMIENNPFTNEEVKTEILKSDKILLYFEEPTCINGVIEYINKDFKDLSKKEYSLIENNIMDIIFEKIVTLGTLEFK